MKVRLKFKVSVAGYIRDEIYDIEADDVARRLVGAGFCDIVPFPPRDTLPLKGE